jgi:hypothetical protein
MTYQKRIEYMPYEKVAPFITLIGKVYAFAGNERDAAKLLNVSRNTFTQLRDEKILTDKQARKILAAYRLIKHHLPQGSKT